MKVAGFGLNTGSGWWRLKVPLKYLAKNGVNAYLSPNAINDEELKDVDIVILKNVTDPMGISTLMAHREMHGLKIVMDLDDDITVRKDNPMLKHHEVEDAGFVFTQTAKIADLITTTTPYLANKLKVLNPKVEVIPNYYDPDFMHVKSHPHDGKLRVGWAGGASHQPDLLMIAPIIKRLKEKYDIVACGDPRIKQWWGDDVEVFPVCPIEYYYERIASMAIDIGICPLVDDEFNHCKSQIKAMEFGLLGIPAVCSPTVYGDYPVLDIATTEQDWFDRIDKLAANAIHRKTKRFTQKSFWEENFDISKKWKDWEVIWK